MIIDSSDFLEMKNLCISHNDSYLSLFDSYYKYSLNLGIVLQKRRILTIHLELNNNGEFIGRIYGKKSIREFSLSLPLLKPLLLKNNHRIAQIRRLDMIKTYQNLSKRLIIIKKRLNI